MSAFVPVQVQASPTPASSAATVISMAIAKGVIVQTMQRRGCSLALQAGLIEFVIRNNKTARDILEVVESIYISAVGRMAESYACTEEYLSTAAPEAAAATSPGPDLALVIFRELRDNLRTTFPGPEQYAQALMFAKNLPFPQGTIQTFVQSNGQSGKALLGAYRKACDEASLLPDDSGFDVLKTLLAKYRTLDKEFAGGERRVRVWVRELLGRLAAPDLRVITTVVALQQLLCRESNDHRAGGKAPLPRHLSTVVGMNPYSIAALLLAMYRGNAAAAEVTAQAMDDFAGVADYSGYCLPVALTPPDADYVQLDPAVHGTSRDILTLHQLLVFEQAALQWGGLGGVAALFGKEPETEPWQLDMSDSDQRGMHESHNFPLTLRYHAVLSLGD